MDSNHEVAVLGGGCFWCIESAFNSLQGVKQAVSGYCGGHLPNPTYEAVCTKTTGHIEVVRIEFDPAVIDYRALLEIFFTLHDPTTLDYQGNDFGPQYRSAIFCQSPGQRQIASEVIAQLNDSGEWRDPIVTDIRDADTFYPAEDYHQRYFELNGRQPYCATVIAPKMAKFAKRFRERLKSA